MAQQLSASHEEVMEVKKELRAATDELAGGTLAACKQALNEYACPAHVLMLHPSPADPLTACYGGDTWQVRAQARTGGG